MKERPILFSAPMVRALLAGTKTQTRRVVKPQPVYGDVQGLFQCWQFPHKRGHLLYPNAKDQVIALCPYGQPGDRLWVRETFAAWWDTATGKRTHVMGYRADINDPDWDGFGADDPWWLDAKWEPSIHMPRNFSRITLEITGVRVERLQDISEEDAKAEGVERHAPACVVGRPYRVPYSVLWESINGPGSWDANPWVWVVEFKRVTG